MESEFPALVTDTSFTCRVLDPTRTVLVLFTARGCHCCKEMEITLGNLASELERTVEVVRCSFHESPGTFRRYRVRRVPELILFGGGIPLGARSGCATIVEVRRWIRETLQSWVAPTLREI